MGDEADYLYSQEDHTAFEEPPNTRIYKHRIQIGQEELLVSLVGKSGAVIRCETLSYKALTGHVANTLTQFNFKCTSDPRVAVRSYKLPRLSFPTILSRLQSGVPLVVDIRAQVSNTKSMTVKFSCQPENKIKKRLRDFGFQYNKSFGIWVLYDRNLNDITINKVVTYFKKQENIQIYGGTQ